MVRTTFCMSKPIQCTVDAAALTAVDLQLVVFVFDSPVIIIVA